MCCVPALLVVCGKFTKFTSFKSKINFQLISVRAKSRPDNWMTVRGGYMDYSTCQIIPKDRAANLWGQRQRKAVWRAIRHFGAPSLWRAPQGYLLCIRRAWDGVLKVQWTFVSTDRSGTEKLKVQRTFASADRSEMEIRTRSSPAGLVYTKKARDGALKVQRTFVSADRSETEIRTRTSPAGLV